MQNVLTFTLAVAIALAPASVSAQGRIIGQQSYVTGSKPDPVREKRLKTKKAKAAHHKRKPSHKVAKTPPGKFRLVEIKKAKAAHAKHSNKVARAPHYAKNSYFRAGPQHHWHDNQPWFLPALVGAAIGLGLFRFGH